MPKSLNDYLFRTCAYSVLAFCFILSMLTDCQCQVNTTNQRDSFPKSMIQVDGTYGLPTKYNFFDQQGQCVKTLLASQFQSRHPIYRLKNLFKDTIYNIEAGAFLFERAPLHDSINLDKKARNNLNRKVATLRSLKKYGLVVKTPERATHIIGGHPDFDLEPSVSRPAAKYLTKIETVSILDAYAREPENDETNTLLDCSYITIYDHLSNVFKEVLVPDKIVTAACVSDDGMFMICICSYTYVWDEGSNLKEEGILIINLETNEKQYIVSQETKIFMADQVSLLFAGQYFQMTFGYPESRVGPCYRLYLNPYKRCYYTKSYLKEEIDPQNIILGVPYYQFKGVREDLETFTVFQY